MVESTVFLGQKVQVFGGARIMDMAVIGDLVKISGHAEVSGQAHISGEVKLSGYSAVFDQAQVCGAAQLLEEVEVMGDAKVGQLGVTLETVLRGKVQVCDQARVFGFVYADDYAKIVDNAVVSSTTEPIHLNGVCFVGTDALVNGPSDVASGQFQSGSWTMYRAKEGEIRTSLLNIEEDHPALSAYLKLQEEFFFPKKPSTLSPELSRVLGALENRPDLRDALYSHFKHLWVSGQKPSAL